MKTILNKAKEIVTNHKTEIGTAAAAVIFCGTVALLCYYGHKKNLIHAAEGERILRILQENLL